ncbi:MAG: putative repair protein RecO [Pseudomonadota bacterium]|jgi:DNA repair protein RecO (recombination protein O)
MEWHDDGLILSVRKHGETAAIVSLLTREHGRHLGLVRGGQSRRRQGLLQPGNLVAAGWRARLPEHLGTLTLESRRELAASVMEDGGRLRALAAMTALLEAALAEQEPQPSVFAASVALAEHLAAGEGAQPGGPPSWLAAYVRWELALLRELGFGLDLDSCAATGVRENLVYVSPRSGRAVSAEAGEPWRDRLLALPAFLCDAARAPGDVAEILAGLRLTGHFLERHHFAAHGGHTPAARERLLAALGT